MTIFIGMLLTIVSFAFITYPLLKQKTYPADSAEDENLRELQSRRDTTYSMLKELEFDYQSGILTEEDYHDLETRYKGKAISILKDIDSSGTVDEVEDEIEKQVKKLRRDKGRFCPQCGVAAPKEDQFCSQCGAKLA